MSRWTDRQTDQLTFFIQLGEFFIFQSKPYIRVGEFVHYEETSDLINRAHDYETYVDAVKRLRVHNINVCTHLINGLPGETSEMMLENVRRMVLDSDIQGVKLHLLHLMKQTRLQRDYHEGKLQLM